MPPKQSDHRDPDHDVEHGVENLGRAPGEERQQPDLNGVGDDGDDSRREDPALSLLHVRTLGSASGAGQTSLARGRRSLPCVSANLEPESPQLQKVQRTKYLQGGVDA